MIHNQEEIEETTIYGIKILQYKNRWRFSHDSLMLSKFCTEVEGTHFKNEPKKFILDVGTGCGIIPVLLRNFLQTDSIYYGIEIDKEVAKLAEMNFRLNKIKAYSIAGDIRFAPFKFQFDIIVSNPPYVPVGEGKISTKYDKAKWEITFDLRSFARVSSKILKKGGRIYVVYNPSRLGEILSVFYRSGLMPSFIRFFHHSSERSCAFFLLCAQKESRRKLEVLPPMWS